MNILKEIYDYILFTGRDLKQVLKRNDDSYALSKTNEKMLNNTIKSLSELLISESNLESDTKKLNEYILYNNLKHEELNSSKDYITIDNKAIAGPAKNLIIKGCTLKNEFSQESFIAMSSNIKEEELEDEDTYDEFIQYSTSKNDINYIKQIQLQPNTQYTIFFQLKASNNLNNVNSELLLRIDNSTGIAEVDSPKTFSVKNEYSDFLFYTFTTDSTGITKVILRNDFSNFPSPLTSNTLYARNITILKNKYDNVPFVDYIYKVHSACDETEYAGYGLLILYILDGNEQILEVVQKVISQPLRAINGHKDIYDESTHILTQCIGKYVLDGSSSQGFTLNTSDPPTDTSLLRFDYNNIPSLELLNNDCNVITDNFNNIFIHKLPNGSKSINCENICNDITTKNQINIIIKKSKLKTLDVAGFVEWLKDNPITIYYVLDAPVISKIDPLIEDDSVIFINPSVEEGKITHVNSVRSDISFDYSLNTSKVIEELLLRVDTLEKAVLNLTSSNATDR